MSDIESKFHILFFNLKINYDEEFLFPGLILKKVSPISVFDLALAGTKGFREWAVLEPIINRCTTELISWDTPELITPPGYDALNRVWLFSAMLVLNDFQEQLPVAFNTYSWSMFAGQTNPGVERNLIPKFEGNLLDFVLSYKKTNNNITTSWNSAHKEFIQKNFIIANKLAHDNEAFRLGLESLYDWRFAKDPRMAIARLWIGIEAVININSELSFRIALYAATILEEKGEKRQLRFREIKRLYSMRSKAVHGDPMTEDLLNETIMQSFRLLKDLISYCCKIEHMITTDYVEFILLGQ